MLFMQADDRVLRVTQSDPGMSSRLLKAIPIERVGVRLVESEEMAEALTQLETKGASLAVEDTVRYPGLVGRLADDGQSMALYLVRKVRQTDTRSTKRGTRRALTWRALARAALAPKVLTPQITQAVRGIRPACRRSGHLPPSSWPIGQRAESRASEQKGSVNRRSSLSQPAVADPRFIGPIDRHIVNNSHIFWEIFQKYL